MFSMTCGYVKPVCAFITTGFLSERTRVGLEGGLVMGGVSKFIIHVQNQQRNRQVYMHIAPRAININDTSQ